MSTTLLCRLCVTFTTACAVRHSTVSQANTIKFVESRCLAGVVQVQKMHDAQEVAAPEMRSAKRRKTSPEVPAAKKKPAIATSTWYASASHWLVLRSHCYARLPFVYIHTDKSLATCKVSVQFQGYTDSNPFNFPVLGGDARLSHQLLFYQRLFHQQLFHQQVHNSSQCSAASGGVQGGMAEVWQ